MTNTFLAPNHKHQVKQNNSLSFWPCSYDSDSLNSNDITNSSKAKMVNPNVDKAEEQNDSNPKYRGVRKRKWGKWVSEIRLPNSRQRIWLGSYDSAEKAARAFDAAMFCLRGRNGRFNFPDNPPDIAGGRNMTPSQIQAAAARFANPDPEDGLSGRPESMECSMEGTVSRVEPQSPSNSMSEVTVQMDSDVTLNAGLVPDLSAPIGSGNFYADYGYFPGFDDFGAGFYMPGVPNVDYVEENMDGLIVDESFLWNF